MLGSAIIFFKNFKGGTTWIWNFHWWISLWIFQKPVITLPIKTIYIQGFYTKLWSQNTKLNPNNRYKVRLLHVKWSYGITSPQTIRNRLGSITAVATHFEVAKNPIDMHYFACPKFSYVNLGIFLCTQKNFIQKSSTNHE